MKYHILNGDALKFQLQKTELEGNFIIARECLIDGKVDAVSIEEFWLDRANFIGSMHGFSADSYIQNTQYEFEKILKIPENASVYLWFERDLFCQVNMWFTLDYIQRNLGTDHFYLYLILPNHNEWTGFGHMSTEELLHTFEHKIKLKKEDINVFTKAWKAYQNNNLAELDQLAQLVRKQYPYFPEIVQAHLDRFVENGSNNRPEKTILSIIQEKQTTSFGEIFEEFSQREGVYGFGDLQVKQIYQKLMHSNS